MGHSCFSLNRRGPTFWNRQRVRLSGNLLLVVALGTLVVERRWQRVAVNEGGACWLLPGEFKLSEVPDVAGRFSGKLVFFNDQALARSIGGQDRLESLCRIPNMSMHKIYPQPRLGSVLLEAAHACGIEFPGELRKALIFAANSGGSAMFMFLEHGFFAKKTALNLWMEDHVISKKSANDLANVYPAGRRKFFSDFSVYETLSPGQWLRKRRMQLASTWIKHGAAPIELIPKAAGYDDVQRYRRDYIYERGHDPRREERLRDAHILCGKGLRDCIMPFWYVAPFSLWDELQRLHDNSDMEIPKFTAAQRRRALRHLYVDGRKKTDGRQPMPAVPPVQEAEVDLTPYWEMKSTCAANIIRVPPGVFTGGIEPTVRSMAA
jgi:AraC-like DNA-binding protein